MQVGVETSYHTGFDQDMFVVTIVVDNQKDIKPASSRLLDVLEESQELLNRCESLHSVMTFPRPSQVLVSEWWRRGE